MKTVHVDCTFSETYSYALGVPINFTTDGTITALTNATTCRELAIGYFSSFLLKKMPTTKKGRAVRQRKIAQATEKARVIFYGLNNAQAKDLEGGKTLSVLHLLEEKISMPKTRVVRIESADASRSNKFMFIGNNRWFRSSHTMSLWFLLIRLALRSKTFRATDWDELKKKLKKFPKEGHGGSNTLKRDQYYTRISFKNWIPLMTNVNKIYPPNVKWVDRFNPEKVHTAKDGPYTNSIGSEGIMKLVKNQSHHAGGKVFKKIMKEASKQ